MIDPKEILGPDGMAKLEQQRRERAINGHKSKSAEGRESDFPGDTPMPRKPPEEPADRPPPYPGTGEQKPATVEIIRGDAVEIKPIEWAWDGFLAIGKLHILVGPPEAGKTNVAIKLGSIVTTRGIWPDGSRCNMCGTVLIWSGEDAIKDTLAPRLKASGADMTKIAFVGATIEHGKKVAFDPARHMDALLASAQKIGDVKMIIIDPIVSAVAGDSHKNAETRRGLQPVVDFAEKVGAIVLGITHFTKGTAGRSPLDRVTGSLAFGALARMVFVAAVNASGDESLPERLFIRAKSNIGPTGDGFGYSLSVAEIETPKGLAQATFVEWGDRVEGNAAGILARAETEKPEARSTLEDAKTCLKSILQFGPMGSKEVMREAQAQGLSEKTVNRAKKELGIKSAKNGFNGDWMWKLPS